MERFFQEQEQRIDRLMALVRAADFPDAVNGALTFYDIAILTCQAMWHMKDWILNDAEFRAASREELKRDIYNSHVLQVCADIANGSKHLSLKSPKIGTGVSLAELSGIHIEPAKGIFREFYYIHYPNLADPYHGTEIRDLLEDARRAWQVIIDKYYLSEEDRST
ncbi:MAG: hypothetical protein WD572_09935 [Gammaproteobacteria bacterium]